MALHPELYEPFELFELFEPQYPELCDPEEIGDYLILYVKV